MENEKVCKTNGNKIKYHKLIGTNNEGKHRELSTKENVKPT